MRGIARTVDTVVFTPGVLGSIVAGLVTTSGASAVFWALHGPEFAIIELSVLAPVFALFYFVSERIWLSGDALIIRTGFRRSHYAARSFTDIEIRRLQVRLRRPSGRWMRVGSPAFRFGGWPRRRAQADVIVHWWHQHRDDPPPPLARVPEQAARGGAWGDRDDWSAR